MLRAYGVEIKKEHKKVRNRLGAKVWASQKELCCTETSVCLTNVVRRS